MKTLGILLLACIGALLVSAGTQKDVNAMKTKNAYGLIFASWVEGLEVDAVSVVFQGDDGGGYDTIADDEYDVHPVRGALVRRHYDVDNNAVDWDGYTSGVRASYTLYNPTAGTLGGIAAGGTLDVSNEAQTLGYLDYGIPLYDNNGNLLATASPRDLRVLAKVFNRTIQSDNFVEGVSGWRVRRNGDAEFNNITVRGEGHFADDDVVLDGDGIHILTPSADKESAQYNFVNGSGDIQAYWSHVSAALAKLTYFVTNAEASKYTTLSFLTYAPATYAATTSITSQSGSGSGSASLQLIHDTDATIPKYGLLNQPLGIRAAVLSPETPKSLLDVKTHSNYAGSGWQHDTAAVQTTNNTITTLYSKTLDDNTVYSFRVHIVARRTDSGTENGIYARQFGVYRQSAGGATLIAAADTIGTDRETTMAATITVDTSSNDIRVRVTGATSKTYVWVCTVEWQAVSTSS